MIYLLVSHECRRSLQHVSERVVTAPTKDEKSAETNLGGGDI